MEDFLAGQLFRQVLFPVASVVLGIGIKYASRPDKFAKFKADDLAVGLDLMLTALLSYLVLYSDRARAVSSTLATLGQGTKAEVVENVKSLWVPFTNAGWHIAWMLLGLWSVSTIVRRWGWKEEGTESNLTGRVGIALPLFSGVLYLLFVMGA